MNYFDHENISASDLKSFLKKLGGGYEDPANLEQIFEFGTLFHQTILEPHKNYNHEPSAELRLATNMKDTFFKDDICRMFITGHDFKREEEFYEVVEVGGMQYKARCKADGSRRGISSLLELKGLKMTSSKTFDAAIDRLNYDMTAVHYMLTARAERMLIVGISKIDPRIIFKKIIKRCDETYIVGEEKLIQTLRLLRQYSEDDVKLVA